MVGSSLALPPGLFHEDQNQSPFLCAIAFLSMTLSSLEEPLLSPWESLYQPALDTPLGGTHWAALPIPNANDRTMVKIVHWPAI